MKQKRIIITAYLIEAFATTVYPQIFDQPNYALKSPETLIISKIDASAEKTIVYLSIENRRTDGSFCADRNISLIESGGRKLKLLNSSGIPVCPDTYKFKTIGEKLNFTLTFPPLGKGTNWVDLIEECSDNCFSFYGVVLDNTLNKKIDDAFTLAENGERAKALISFINIAEDKNLKNQGAEGLIYLNIITLAKDEGNITRVSEWYTRLKSSGLPDQEKYINYLNSLGIIY